MGKVIRFRKLTLIFPFVAFGTITAQSPSPAVPAENAPTPAGVAVANPAKAKTKVETIVFVRHGEKSAADDNGQLTVQGLNRALALPAVLNAKFGRPDFVFAPLPTRRKDKTGGTFSYVRPLMTIEPTAIRAGLPVDARFAFDEIGSLQSELCEKSYQQATIFVAWEHHKLEEIVKRMVSAFGGDEKSVPDWQADDFDSIFVLRLRDEPQGKKSITFEHDHEGLNGLSRDYPAAGGK